MARCGNSKDFAVCHMNAFKAIVALVVVIAMSSPAFGQITVITPKAGQTVTEKAITITGNATAAPSLYIENDKTALDAGSKSNFTITTKPSLVLAPYIGVWNKGDANPEIKNSTTPSAYDYVGVNASSVILDGNTYKLWGIGLSTGNVPHFGMWTSADGKTWAEPTGMSIFNRSVTASAFDFGSIDAPWVIKDGATYKMWYSGKGQDNRWRIGYATSTDGVTWSRGNSGNPVLDRGLIARFDGGGVAAPTVIKDGNTYKMWYTGVIESTTIWQIGYATSANGISWTRQNNSNPVLGFGKKGTYDESGLLYPRVIKDGSTYRLWYIGINQKAVCYATSTDGTAWARDPNNPVLTPGGAADFDASFITEFAIMRDGLQFKMWYTGANSALYTVGYAYANVEGMTGIYISKPFDAQNNVSWGQIMWNWYTPASTTGEVDTRTSEDNSKWTAWAQATNNTQIQSPPHRFFQYRVDITTTDSNVVSEFYNMSVEYRQVLRVEVSLDNSSWFIANGTTQWDIQMTLTEGNNTIYVKVTDTTPYPQYMNFVVLVDTTPPTGHIVINKGATFTTTPSVTLTLNSQDLNGVKKMRIGNSGDLTNATWENYGTNKTWTLTALDGVKTVYVEFQDSNGLISRTYSDTIILDTTPPMGSLLINDNATYAAVPEVHVSLKATDKSGIAKMRVSTNETFQGADWGPFTNTLSITLPTGDGEKWVYAQFVDSAGLTTTVKDSIILDTIKPIGSITIDNGTTLTRDRNVYLTLDASDANGVKDMMVSGFPDFVDGIWVPMAAHMNWTMPNSLGDNYVYARFRDSAGLTSDRASAHIFLYTRTLAGSLVINNGDKLTGNPAVTLTINLLDNDGLTKMMVSNDDRFVGGVWQNFNKTLSWTLSGDTNAEYFVYLKFKDQYGIESATFSSSINLDTMAPVVTLTYPTRGLVLSSTNGTIDITGTATDETGLSRLQVQVDGGPWIQMQEFGHFKLRQYLTQYGSHTVNARAVDYVGNQANATVTFTWPAPPKKPAKHGIIPGFEGLALIAVVALVPLLRHKRKKA